MQKEKRDIESLRKKSLHYSIKDGSASAVMDSAGNSSISPLALALGASNSYIGFLSSLPNLVSSIFQLRTPRFMEKFSRKSIVTKSALLQALIWLPIMVISLLNFRLKGALVLLLIFYVMLVSFNSAIGPAWTSWMKDIVPEKNSGKFFGKRSMIVGFVGLVSLLFMGIVLDTFKKADALFFGFAALFAAAFFARYLSRYFLLQKYEPKLELGKSYYFSFRQFLRSMHANNFGRFVFFVALFQFAVQIASPFFVVYMLKQLNFTYMMYTILITSQTLATLSTMPLWGKLGDRHGNLFLIKSASMFIPIIPFLWLFSSNFYYLFAVQALTGFLWAGFNLGASNFIYDAVSRERIGLCVAYSNIITTVGVFLGATFGGFLSTHFFTGVFSFFALLVVSGTLRFLVPVLMLRNIKEVRQVKPFDMREAVLNQLYDTMKFLRIMP